MITERTLVVAQVTAAELRRRGETEQAEAIEALVAAVRDEAMPSFDLPTDTEAGDLLGAGGQTIGGWARDGQLAGYRVGRRIVIPRETVAEYVRRAGSSLDLDDIPPGEAARLVAEGRRAAS